MSIYVISWVDKPFPSWIYQKKNFSIWLWVKSPAPQGNQQVIAGIAGCLLFPKLYCEVVGNLTRPHMNGDLNGETTWCVFSDRKKKGDTPRFTKLQCRGPSSVLGSFIAEFTKLPRIYDSYTIAVHVVNRCKANNKLSPISPEMTGTTPQKVVGLWHCVSPH